MAVTVLTRAKWQMVAKWSQFIFARLEIGKNELTPFSHFPPDGGAVLPGFSLPLRQLFAELDPQ
jgi:hypothetical protein